MAELIIVVANVVSGTPAGFVKDYPAGESILQGMLIYHQLSDNKWYMCQNDGTALQSGSGPLVGPGGIGIATNPALLNQPVVAQVSGQIVIGATITVGTHYFGGPTFGGIGVFSDVASGKFVTRVGYGLTTTIMQLDLKATGLALA